MLARMRAVLAPAAAAPSRLATTWAAVFGNGDNGRLGQGTGSSSRPRPLMALKGHEIRDVACGGAHTALLTEAGRLFLCGLNDYGQCGTTPASTSIYTPTEAAFPDGSRVVTLAAGHYHTLAVTANGDVWAFGRNDRGQLGLGLKSPPSCPTPQKLESLCGAGVVAVAAGASHSLAVTDAGDVLSWGCAESGRLGHGPPPSRAFWAAAPRDEFVPRRVASLTRARGVAAGHAFSLVMDSSGGLVGMGGNGYGQLGLGHDRDVWSPESVADLPPVASVSGGALHAGAVARDSGELWVWGADQEGSLGLGSQGGGARTVPQAIPGLPRRARFQSVACGWKHTAAISVSGELFTFGWSGSVGGYGGDGDGGESTGGQLGHGDDSDQWQPTPVRALLTPAAAPGARRVVKVSCGLQHTAVVVVDER